MGLGKKILKEGKIFDSTIPSIKEHISWLEDTIEVVKEIDKLFKEISYKIGGDLPKVKTQFMWDNQTDMYKWYDLEIRISFKNDDVSIEEIEKILHPIKKHIHDLEINNKELYAWIAIK